MTSSIRLESCRSAAKIVDKSKFHRFTLQSLISISGSRRISRWSKMMMLSSVLFFESFDPSAHLPVPESLNFSAKSIGFFIIFFCFIEFYNKRLQSTPVRIFLGYSSIFSRPIVQWIHRTILELLVEHQQRMVIIFREQFHDFVFIIERNNWDRKKDQEDHQNGQDVGCVVGLGLLFLDYPEC